MNKRKQFEKEISLRGSEDHAKACLRPCFSLVFKHYSQDAATDDRVSAGSAVSSDPRKTMINTTFRKSET